MTDLKICPRCHYQSVAFDHVRQLYACLWEDCGWTSLRGERPLEDYTDEVRPPNIRRRNRDQRDHPLAAAGG